ncbi:MAG TPA: sulfite exporter TauE/SafE family protein [Steroidobacteraceae bacterium]|nr:sulfite exporter TauE/SafE family protein [Steroidobacteraceae bacterium]
MSAVALSMGAALAAGLAGSAHCAAMCGGIAAAVGATFPRGAGLPLGAALAFNAARLASYALVGALLAAVLGGLAAPAPLPLVALAARVFAALVLGALALRLLTGRDLLGAERIGQAFWARLRPAFGRAVRLPAPLRPAAVGLLWGFMPCGLVYSVLLVAAASGSAAAGAATMLAFGAGTLPALLGLTLGGATLAARLRRPALRRLGGGLVLVAALWTLAAALWHPPGMTHEHAHHAAHAATAAPAAGRLIASANPNP